MHAVHLGFTNSQQFVSTFNRHKIMGPKGKKMKAYNSTTSFLTSSFKSMLTLFWRLVTAALLGLDKQKSLCQDFSYSSRTHKGCIGCVWLTGVQIVHSEKQLWGGWSLSIYKSWYLTIHVRTTLQLVPPVNTGSHHPPAESPKRPQPPCYSSQPNIVTQVITGLDFDSYFSGNSNGWISGSALFM